MADDLKNSDKDARETRSINVRKAQANASGRVFDTISRLDRNGDGVIDEEELVMAVEELVNQLQTTKYLKLAIMFAAVLFVLLTASMAGLTYGIVYLTKDTRIAPGNFMVVKGQEPGSKPHPVLTGGAVVDLARTQFNAADIDIIVVALEGRRRRLQASGDASSLPGNPNPDLTYHSTVPLAMLEELCNLHYNGLATFTGTLSNNATMETEVQEVHIRAVSGCDKISTDLAAFHAKVAIDSIRVEVHCTDAACAAYYDQGSLRMPDQVPEPQSQLISQVVKHQSITVVDANGTILAANNDTSKLLPATESDCEAAGYSNCGKCTAFGTKVMQVGAGLLGLMPTGSTMPDYAVKHTFPHCCHRCADSYVPDGKCGCTEVYLQCFPASATITVAGKGMVTMEALQYGDHVLSIDRATGAKVFKEVFLFGHRDNVVESPYINVRTTSNHTLQLTPSHFMPVCTAACTAADLAAGAMVLEHKYASDVRKGDMVLVVPAGLDQQLVEPSAVVDVWVTRARGAYNPFVRGADLIVNGVAASSHSQWLLDSVTPISLRKHLPAVYEAMLAPVYLLYNIIGSGWAEWLAHGVGLAEAGASEFFGAGYLAVTGTMAAGLAVPLMLVRTSCK